MNDDRDEAGRLRLEADPDHILQQRDPLPHAPVHSRAAPPLERRDHWSPPPPEEAPERQSEA